MGPLSVLRVTHVGAAHEGSVMICCEASSQQCRVRLLYSQGHFNMNGTSHCVLRPTRPASCGRAHCKVTHLPRYRHGD